MNDQQETQYTHQISKLLSPDFTFSKRQLGIILLVGGIIGLIGLLGLDLIGAGREGGIGPAQRAGIAGMIVIILVGISLIPLGDRPA